MANCYEKKRAGCFHDVNEAKEDLPVSSKAESRLFEWEWLQRAERKTREEEEQGGQEIQVGVG